MQPVVRRHKNSNNLIEEWYLNGKIYRLDGPACTDWYKNGNKKSEE
jgi:hypothetical protein